MTKRTSTTGHAQSVSKSGKEVDAGWSGNLGIPVEVVDAVALGLRDVENFILLALSFGCTNREERAVCRLD